MNIPKNNYSSQLLGTTEFDTETPQSISTITIPEEFYNRIYSGIKIIDNLFNGFVPGQVIGLYAQRGCGKTTFMLQLSSSINSFNRNSSLFISCEETIQQIAYTANRVQAINSIFVAHKSYIEDIIPQFSLYPVICIDSLSGLSTKQSINKTDVPVFVLQQIYREAKKNKNVIFFTLHMSKNKQTSIGKTAIEHIADTIFRISHFEEKQINNGRKITVEKNRMGSVGEICITIDQQGFDFTNILSDKTTNNVTEKILEQINDKKNQQKVHEIEKLIDLAKKNKKITYNDLNIIASGDVQMFDRLERRIKSLIKMGILEKDNNGEFIYKENK